MKKGFTIIELLVVIIIIGILAAMTLPMFKGDNKQQKLCMQNISNIYGAIEAFRDNEGVYPPDGTGGTDSLKTALTNAGLVSDPDMFKCPADKSAGTDSYSVFYAKRSDYDMMDAYTLGCPRHKDKTATLAVFLEGQTMRKSLAAARYKAGGAAVEPGDTLAAGQTVLLADGSEITAASGSVIFLQSFNTGNNTCYSIVKSPGESVTVNNIKPGSRFEEVTPAGIAGVKGTELEVTVERLSGSIYTVKVDTIEGTATLTTAKGKTDVSAGSAAQARSDTGKITKAGTAADGVSKDMAYIKGKLAAIHKIMSTWPPGWRNKYANYYHEYDRIDGILREYETYSGKRAVSIKGAVLELKRDVDALYAVVSGIGVHTDDDGADDGERDREDDDDDGKDTGEGGGRGGGEGGEGPDSGKKVKTKGKE